MRRVTTIATILVAAVLLVVLGCTEQIGNAAPAAGRGQGQGVRAGQGCGQQLFERHDANKDGKITKDEFPGPDEAFARLDANGDGAITADELQALRPRHSPGAGGPRGNMDPAQRWQRMCQRLDKNGDGRISRDEFPGPAEMFARLDQDGDGFVTQQEAQTAGERFRQVMRDPAQRWQAMLEHSDKDGDGRISREEFAGPDQIFDRLDANGDGFLAQEEAKAVPGPGGPMGMRRGFLGRLDADGDGKVTRAEWTAGFDRLDTNGDGVLDQQDRPQRPGQDRPAQ